MQWTPWLVSGDTRNIYINLHNKFLVIKYIERKKQYMTPRPFHDDATNK